VSWAAAIGHEFDTEIVGRATGMSAGDMLSALDKLERSALLRITSDRSYDFTHDLIRDAAYQMISGPRRTLVHRNIARALRDAHDPQSALAGEIVHHAFLAGDYEMAATAAVAAGRRCLRMFAYAEAVGVARRGLQIAESLAGDTRLDTEMRLLQVIVMARTPIRERAAMAGRVSDVIERARAAGLAKTAALGAQLLAILNEEMSDYGRAADASIQSAEMSRGADSTTAAFLIANTARCLLFLQRDIQRAESLLAEAQAMGIENTELELGWGYLHAHYGRSAEAAPYLERAFMLASRREDHWREWVALARLVTMALEDGHADVALAHCERLRPVAEKMSGGTEGVRTLMLETLSRYAAGLPTDIDAMFEQLRAIDSKSDLAWALAFAAELELGRGEHDRAREHAQQGLLAAEIVGRQSEAVIARAVLDALPGKHNARRARRSDNTNDLTARARKYLKETSHGHPRAGAHL
jgi:tetratricopeptide (TPR) repeat protein